MLRGVSLTDLLHTGVLLGRRAGWRAVAPASVPLLILGFLAVAEGASYADSQHPKVASWCGTGRLAALEAHVIVMMPVLSGLAAGLTFVAAVPRIARLPRSLLGTAVGAVISFLLTAFAVMTILGFSTRLWRSEEVVVVFTGGIFLAILAGVAGLSILPAFQVVKTKARPPANRFIVLVTAALPLVVLAPTLGPTSLVEPFLGYTLAAELSGGAAIIAAAASGYVAALLQVAALVPTGVVAAPEEPAIA